MIQSLSWSDSRRSTCSRMRPFLAPLTERDLVLLPPEEPDATQDASGSGAASPSGAAAAAAGAAGSAKVAALIERLRQDAAAGAAAMAAGAHSKPVKSVVFSQFTRRAGGQRRTGRCPLLVGTASAACCAAAESQLPTRLLPAPPGCLLPSCPLPSLNLQLPGHRRAGFGGPGLPHRAPGRQDARQAARRGAARLCLGWVARTSCDASVGVISALALGPALPAAAVPARLTIL